MTRIALISDVHANLPALEAVLRDVEARSRCDALYHLGDLVGYAPWPNEVVELLAGVPGVAGNYDSTVAADHPHCGCRYEDPEQEALAHESYAWTRAHVSARTRRALGALPFRLDIRPFGGHAAGPTIALVHGNHSLNTVYTTADRSDETLARMASSMGLRSGDVVCFGHTHLPWERTVDGVRFVNTGSVGRPKDGDPRAGYVVLDCVPGEITIHFERVEYDVERAVAEIGTAGLPAAFGEFLRRGGRPATATTHDAG